MKTKWKLAHVGLIAVLAFSLSGCVKLNMDLKVNSDDTVDGVVILAISDALAALGAEPTASASSSTDSTDSLFDASTPNMSQSKYSEGGFTGQKYEFKGTPLAAFKTTGKNEGEFGLERVGDTIVASGNFDMTSDSAGTQDPSDPFSAEIAKSMSQGMDLRVSITFPGAVTSSNGEISADKKTVTWKLEMNSKNELQAVAEAPLAKPILGGNLLPVVIGILVLMAGLGFLVAKKRKPYSKNEADEIIENFPRDLEEPEQITET